MRAGLLTQHINFWKPEVIKTETGSEVNVYEEKHKCRARVTYTSGDKDNLNGDTFYSTVVVFEIRQGLVFDELYRIEWDGSFYQILSIEKNRPNQSIIIKGAKVND